MKKEAIWTLSNIITGSTHGILNYLLPLEQVAIPKVLTQNLGLQDIRFLKIVLEAIEAFLKLDSIYGWSGE